MQLLHTDNSIIDKTFYTMLYPSLEKFRKEGMLIISTGLSILHIDNKAMEIFQKFLRDESEGNNLAAIISEIARLFTKKPDPEEVIIKDYHFSDRHRLLVRAIGWFSNEEYLDSTKEEPAMILFIEDMNERFQEELMIEQEKYGLTGRETEVYKLLSQSHTYQDIANILYVSLNTVRFHVKNINLKKGSSRN